MASGSQTYKFQNTFDDIKALNGQSPVYISELITRWTKLLELEGLLSVITCRLPTVLLN